MAHIKTRSNEYTPGSVPTVSQLKIYYANEIQALGGTEAWLKSIGSDKPKQLPEIDFSEEEWTQMLNEGL